MFFLLEIDQNRLQQHSCSQQLAAVYPVMHDALRQAQSARLLMLCVQLLVQPGLWCGRAVSEAALHGEPLVAADGQSVTQSAGLLSSAGRDCMSAAACVLL